MNNMEGKTVLSSLKKDKPLNKESNHSRIIVYQYFHSIYSRNVYLKALHCRRVHAIVITNCILLK